MLAMLVWKPHLPTLANSLVILGVMFWLYVMWRPLSEALHGQEDPAAPSPRSWVVTLLVVLALMDPAWRDMKPLTQKVVIITDISTSMNVADDGTDTRVTRAGKIADDMADELRGKAGVKNYRFDVDILRSEDEPDEGTRHTDLGRTVVSLSERPDLSDCKAVILLTDGGDEKIRNSANEVPLYILGIGTDPPTWDDLEIRNAEIPEEVELDTPFKVFVDIVVHSASSGFAAKTKSVDVKVEKKVDGVYTSLETVNVVPRSANGRVEFDLPAEETPGVYQYRLSVKGIKGEMTELNNAREFYS